MSFLIRSFSSYNCILVIIRYSLAYVFYSSQAGGEAIIVSYDHTRIQALEIEYDQRIGVKLRLGLHDQRQTLRRSHFGSLMYGR